MAENKNIRKSLTKKIRFEIFKRDNFTCQYCGRKAPSVILNVDHINPVKNGGDNDIVNLITSCFDCNSGKKARLINDNSIIEKQQKQLELLNEKRQQMEMMVQWRNELKQIEQKQIELIVEQTNSYLSKYHVNENFKKTAFSLLKKYNLELIIKSIDISAERYLKNETDESADLFLDKIPGITKNLSLPEKEQKINHVSGMLSKFFNKDFWIIKSLIVEYCNALEFNCSFSNERIIYEIENDIVNEGFKCYNYYGFSTMINNWIEYTLGK